MNQKAGVMESASFQKSSLLHQCGVACGILIATVVLGGIASADKDAAIKKETSDKPEARASKDTLVLFDGKTLKGWSKTNFGGEGEVTVEDGKLIIEMGVDLSGITWKDAKVLPRTNYEVVLEVQRVNGNDFFCGLTFPVNDDPCSLIVGGWGGGVCGLSSIDKHDASENETTSYQSFVSNRWYTIRLRVEDERIQAWIDKKQIVDQKIKGRKLSVRGEVELSRPLGLATWQTTAAIRKFEIHKLEKPAAKDAKKETGKKEQPND